MHDRSRKAQTYEFLKPRAEQPNQAAAQEAFLERRGTTLDYVRTTADPLHNFALPFGEMGPLDGYQWLLLLATHTDRHIAQMEEAPR